MAWILSIASALSLAAAALWTTATAPVTSPPSAPAEAALWPSAGGWAERGLDTLSLEERAGQLVVARLDGEIDADALQLAVEGRLGGIERVVGDEGAHLDLLRRWQTAAAIPLLVLERPGPAPRGGPLASPLAIAATGRTELAYMAGKAVADASTSLGVHIPASPLFATLGTTPFGERGERAPFQRSLVRGLRDGRVLPSTRVSGSALDPAFRPLVDAGLMSVRLSLDNQNPTASTLTAIREDASFNGLVVAEAAPEAPLGLAIEAVGAGADLVVSSAPDEVVRMLAASVRSGTLAESRLDEAVRRVLAVKAWSGLDAFAPRDRTAEASDGPVVRLFPWRPLTDTYRRRLNLLGQEVAREAITVVQADDGPLPLVGSAVPPRVLTLLLDSGLDADRTLPFANGVSTRLEGDVRASYVRLGLGMSQERFDDAASAAREADVVVVGVFDDEGVLPARYRAFLDGLLAAGQTVVLTVFGPPTMAAGLPPADAVVLAYEATEVAQRAAAEAIAGQIDVEGTLPVAVAGFAPAGAGDTFRQQALRPGTAEEAGLNPASVERVDRVLQAAVRNGAFPGASVAIGRDGVLVELRGVGALTRGGRRTTPETPYDLASVTKVVGTTAMLMRLVEDGKVDLDTEVVEYVPTYRGLGKEYVTVRQLLSHSAGHRPWFPFHAHGILNRRDALRFIHADTLQYPPGTRSRYSDFDMIVLGEVIENVTGQRLDEAFEDEIFRPLGMARTGFRRPGTVDPEAAPTEDDRVFRGRTLQGEVHDEAAWVMGGIAGHAGLFSTAGDLARFGFLLANGGEAYGTRLFQPSTLDRFTERVRLRSTYPTGLGWMVQDASRSYSSAGSLFGPRSFGHTGFTGTSLWVDPDQELFVVLLSNRVHPTRRNRRIRDVRSDLADAVAGAVVTPPGEAARGWGFGPVPDDLPAFAAR
ncbi:MAG: serine hydrolase [Bacteroidota bacterium]